MSRSCNRLECQLIGFHTPACERDAPEATATRNAQMPAVEFHLTLDRRELASVLAGLRLLRWMSGPDRRLLPHGLVLILDIATSDNGAVNPLSDAEICELARRLG